MATNKKCNDTTQMVLSANAGKVSSEDASVSGIAPAALPGSQESHPLHEHAPVNAEQRGVIIDSILSRSGRQSLPAFKLMLWDVTVDGTKLIKRMFDLFFSSLGILCLSPLFILVALLIKLEDGGKIIYRQIRVGKDGRHFNFYKFRSMVENADKIKAQLEAHNESGDGVIFKMKHDPRITRIGRFIRRFSIDELPQLFNVLTGDMSLVGPRPPLPSEVVQYTLEDRKRLHVVPGLTCLWQIQGRSTISFNDQVKLDKQYIGSQSLWYDFKILLKTIPAIFIGKGAY